MSTPKVETLSLPLEIADEMTCGSKNFDGYEVVENKIIGTSRWSIIRQIVFRKDGQLWGFTYERGATEYQDGYELPDPVTCYAAFAEPAITYKLVK